jgi:phage-related protein
MIYNKNIEYRLKLYTKIDGRSPVLEYIENLPEKEKAKVLKYIEFLRIQKGVLDEPYSKHIKGKIRELRVDFAKSRHRIFYFTFIEKVIILLHAFRKTTAKTPVREIEKAEVNYKDVIINYKLYE